MKSYICLLFFSYAIVYSQELNSARYDTIEKYLELSGSESNYRKLLVQLKEVMSQKMSGIPQVDEFLTEFYDDFFGWDGVKKDLIKIFSEEFTESEINDLIKFHTSYIGQKIVQRTPLLFQRSIEATQKRMQEQFPIALKKFDDYIQDSLTNKISFDSTLNCEAFDSGIFVPVDKRKGNFCVIRTNDKQIEVIPDLDLRNEYKVLWLNKAEYNLIYQRSSKESALPFKAGETINVKIISFQENQYTYIMTLQGRKSCSSLYKVQ